MKASSSGSDTRACNPEIKKKIRSLTEFKSKKNDEPEVFVSVSRRKIMEVQAELGDIRETLERRERESKKAFINYDLPNRFKDMDWRNRCLILLLEIEHDLYCRDTMERVIEAMAEVVNEKRRKNLRVVRDLVKPTRRKAAVKKEVRHE